MNNENVNVSQFDTETSQSVLLAGNQHTKNLTETKSAITCLRVFSAFLFVVLTGGFIATFVMMPPGASDIKDLTLQSNQNLQNITYLNEENTIQKAQIELLNDQLEESVMNVTTLQEQTELHSTQMQLLQDQLTLMQEQISGLSNSTESVNTTVTSMQALQTQLQTAVSLQRTDVIGNYTAVFGEQYDMSPNQTYFRSLEPEVLQDLYISQIEWSGGNATDPIIDGLQFTLSNTKQSTKFLAGPDKEFAKWMNLSEIQSIKSVNVGYASYTKFNATADVTDSVIVELDFFADDLSQSVLTIGNDGAADFYASTGQLDSNIVGAGMTMQQYNTEGDGQQYGFKTIQFSAIDTTIFATQDNKAYTI